MVLIAMPREASGHEPKDAAGSFALVCEDEMRASDQIASLNEELRIARAALDRAEAEKADLRNENFDLRRYFDVNEYVWKERDAIRAELAAAKQYGIDCLSAACATHQIELADAHQKSETETEEFWKCLHERDEKINRLVKELAAVREALRQCTDDCEHLLNILECKAEQEWNYDYQRSRIMAYRTALQSHRRTET